MACLQWILFTRHLARRVTDETGQWTTATDIDAAIFAADRANKAGKQNKRTGAKTNSNEEPGTNTISELRNGASESMKPKTATFIAEALNKKFRPDGDTIISHEEIRDHHTKMGEKAREWLFPDCLPGSMSGPPNKTKFDCDYLTGRWIVLRRAESKATEYRIEPLLVMEKAEGAYPCLGGVKRDDSSQPHHIFRGFGVVSKCGDGVDQKLWIMDLGPSQMFGQLCRQFTFDLPSRLPVSGGPIVIGGALLRLSFEKLKPVCLPSLLVRAPEALAASHEDDETWVRARIEEFASRETPLKVKGAAGFRLDTTLVKFIDKKFDAMPADAPSAEARAFVGALADAMGGGAAAAS